MNEKLFFKIRLYVTVKVTLAIWTLLTWNYFHGGIPSHHLLAREDMPEFSNTWGGLLLPLLTWLLLYRIQRRLSHFPVEKSNVSNPLINIVYGFAGALLFGIALSVIYTLRYSGIPGYMLMSLLIIALFVPIYRAEYLLGFVIGMTFTFGAVLPTFVGSVLAMIGAVIYFSVRGLLRL